ncbi:hypothetical protein LOTGIDRAFT_134805 [Lottia gigantea]|uniref:MRH domain-containing protein n=1 Tax=Lottia gigantea TaxID=225164 RepID=V3ZJ48_LOTGI|nr:hypothetical protein LOTGIDRAFT_134805 [Lottia gigantea]ESO82350.1 hypothetical protein LOTGIDRAFT_134805 [Lottia gigantea]
MFECGVCDNSYLSCDILFTDDWIMIEFRGGDPYGGHCSREKRKAVIIIICNPNADDVKENNLKYTDCYYLFEISHKDACGVPIDIKKSLSVGSIVLIVMASVIALYLLLGFLYQRFVLHAKGMEQIPNYAFWQDFGNLQADGCNLVCRSMSKSRSLPYKGIGDEQLEEDLDRTDDHLLPM